MTTPKISLFSFFLLCLLICNTLKNLPLNWLWTSACVNVPLAKKQVKACGKSLFLILGWSFNCDSLCQTRVIRLVPWCWCWKLVIKNVIKQTFWLQFVTLKTRCGFLLRQNTGKINFFLLHVSISCSPNQHLSFTLCTTSLFSFAQISSCNSKGVQTRWL